MKNIYLDYNKLFKLKKVLIWGLGLTGGGVATAKYFAKNPNCKVLITDLKDKTQLKTSLKKLVKYKNISYRLGKHLIKDFRWADLIVKNPAIPWNHPLINKIQKMKKPITSDTMIFFSQNPAFTIGITGTKGKSSAASILTKILRLKLKVWHCGNSGYPFLKILERIKPDDLVIAELSSFQLEDLHQIKRSPQIAIFLNFFEDHLNRYSDMNEYFKAKSSIFCYQQPADLLIYNSADKFLVNQLKKYQIYSKVKPLSSKNPSIDLTIACAKEFHFSLDFLSKITKNLRPLPFRLEPIRKYKNRTFINDSCSTNPTSTLFGLNRISKKIILICGGEDKNLSYQKLVNFLNYSKKIKEIILLPGTASSKIKTKFKRRFIEVNNLKDAIKISFQYSRPGEVILFSPAAASFGLFKNEFDRGKRFNQLIKALK